MKNRMFMLSLAALTTLVSLTGCDGDLWEFEDSKKGVYIVTDGSPISTMLQESGEFTEWVHVLNYSQTYSALNSLYNARNEKLLYTMFAPTDAALKQHYATMNVSGIEELGVKYATELVKSMTLQEKDTLRFTELFTNTVTVKSYVNLSGRQVDVTVDAETEGFLLGDVHFSRGYVSCANGLVYTADGCLTPLIETLWERLDATKNNTIMMAAIEAAGLKKKLSTEADTTYVAGARRIMPYNFTLLGVTDEVFGKADIHTVDELKQKLVTRSATPEVGADSLLRQYVQYHLFAARYTNQELRQMNGAETSRLRSTMAGNTILVVNQLEDGTVAFNAADLEGQTLLRDSVEAKNGWLHQVAGWLPVYEPSPQTLVWDLADYPEVRNAMGVLYQPADVVADENQYKNTSLTNLPCYTVEQVMGSKNNGYLALHYIASTKTFADCVNHDRVVFNMGYLGSVSMQTPTIVKGKYRVEITMASVGRSDKFMRTYDGSNGGKMHIQVDAVKDETTGKTSCFTEWDATPFPIIAAATPKPLYQGVGSTVLKDEIEFERTESHTFKFTIMDAAASSNSSFSLHVDAITFIPID